MSRFALVLAALLVLGPAAGGTIGKSAKREEKPVAYDVVVEGSQTTTWSVEGKPPYGGCGHATRGNAVLIAPSRGSGTLSFTFSGKAANVRVIALPGGQVFFGIRLEARARGAIQGKYGEYVKSEGYWDPPGVCGDSSGLADNIAPTGSCGAFTGRVHSGIGYKAGRLVFEGGLGDLSRNLDDPGCPLLESWPGLSLKSGLHPYTVEASGVAVSAGELLAGRTIVRTKTVERSYSPPDPYGVLRGETRATWTVTLTPLGKELLAVPAASGAVRGGTLVLDGSKSKGKIVSYKWKLAPGADCPSATKFDHATVLTGVRVSFRALCSVRATLTVKDKDSSDSASISVVVKPRSWTTKFAHVVEGRLNSRLVDGNLALGRNVCAHEGLEGDQHSGHIVHRGGSNGPDDGFTLARVGEGPFRGNWYVAKYTAEVRRASLISRDLFPGSDLYEANEAAGRLPDFQALLASVRDHEQLHSQLIKEALGKADAAKRVEAMTGGDSGELATQVNIALIRLEDALKAATAEPKVKARMRAKWSRPATVLIRAGGGSGFTSRTFPSLAELGDEGA